MKYVSMDIETTSLIPSHRNILMVSMVVEDTKNPLPLEQLPHFTCFVYQKNISGEPMALFMNGWILEILAGKKTSIFPTYFNGEDFPDWPEDRQWELKALEFLRKYLPEHFYSNDPNVMQKTIVLAGKNVASFDLQFMPKVIKECFHYQTIDPGSVFIDWSKDRPLGLGKIKSKCGFSGIVSHNAYEDALDVIRVLRTTYGGNK
jgi:oligoribonuclease